MVITAGGKDEQVIEKPEWGHSAFTRNLLKGLGEGLADENADGIITGDELGGFIRNRVTVDVDGAHTPQKGRIGSEQGEFVFISETLDTEMAEAFPRDVQIENMSSKVKDLERELKKKEQERRMQKVGGEYYNIAFALGRQTGFTLVGSLSSSSIKFGYLTQQEAVGFSNLFNTGADVLPTSERVSVPSFGIEKRVGPVYGGIGFYNTGFSFSETNITSVQTLTSMFNFMHLYTFYPYIISSRIAIGGGIGLGIPVGGQLYCEGACSQAGEIRLKTGNIEKEINILVNSSFAFTERYAIRIYYQHSMTDIGEYYPKVLDDPLTPIDETGGFDIYGNLPGDESVDGYEAYGTRAFGVSLLLRF